LSFADLQVQFEKAGMIDLVVAVLGLFSDGFHQVYKQIVIL
jgi:hypothetical protein